MSQERAPCVVLGCRRTFRRDPDDLGDTEYMCGEHYRLADKPLRALRTKLRRRVRKMGGWSPRLVRMDNWLWARVKRQATERALGL